MTDADAVAIAMALLEAVAIDADASDATEARDETKEDVIDVEATDADATMAEGDTFRLTKTTWSCARVIKCDAK